MKSIEKAIFGWLFQYAVIISVIIQRFHGRKKEGIMKALVVIDIQNMLIRMKPYESTRFLQRVGILIEQARKKGIEVIYVRHKSDSLVPGTKDWQIHEAVAPKEGEKIVEKTYPSSFKDTDFDTYLKDKGIDNLILVGMQVEYCVDTTIRVAFEKNYKITVPQGGTTTFDTKNMPAANIRIHHEKIWDRVFGRVLPIEEVLSFMDEK